MHLSRAVLGVSLARRLRPVLVHMARPFSTTAPIAAELLQDYRPPPPNTMTAARRAKIARIKKHHSMPLYDKQIQTDMERVAQLETMGEREKEERQKVVRKIIETLKDGLGPDFDVVDISPYTWGADLSSVELELAISAKNSLSPDEDPHLFKGFNAHSVADILNSRGLPCRVLHRTDWKNPAAYPLVYSEGGHFYVHPAPSTHHVALRDLLKRYMEQSRYTRLFLSLYRAWLNSYFEERDARRLMTSAAALVVITHLQQQKILPNLQSDNSNAHNVFDALDDAQLGMKKALSEETKMMLVKRQFKHAVGNFFATIYDDFQFRSHMMSVSEGGWVSRSIAVGVVPLAMPAAPPNPLSRKDEDLDLLEIMRAEVKAQTMMRNDITQKYRIPKDQPAEWLEAIWVVQHPYLPKVNLTQRIPGPYFNVMQSLMRRTAVQLKQTTSLPAVFGPEVPPSTGLTVAQLYVTRPPDPVRHENLADDIAKFYADQKPTEAILDHRRRAMDDLRQVLSEMPNSHNFKVEAFGSTVYVDSKTSDLDLVILDESKPVGFPPSVSKAELLRHKVYNMRALAAAMQKAGLFINAKAVPWATVPIVKAVHKPTGVQVDVNTNDRLGIRNTELLTSYCELFPPLDSLIFVIKRWARGNGLNDPSGANGPTGFSSYCLTLMTIFYLQTKGVLPSLQAEIKEPNKPWLPTTKWVRLANDQRLQCDTRFGTGEDWIAPEIGVEDLLVGFFRYWGDVHNYGNNIASIKIGVPLPRTVPLGEAAVARAQIATESEVSAPSRPSSRRSNSSDDGLFSLSDEDLESDAESMRSGSRQSDRDEAEAFEQPKSWAEKMLVVQDPFILIKNVAGGVQKGVLQRFRQHCMRTYSALNEGKPLKSVLPQQKPEAKPAREAARHPGPSRGKPQYTARPDKRVAAARHYSTSNQAPQQHPSSTSGPSTSNLTRGRGQPAAGGGRPRVQTTAPARGASTPSRTISTVSWVQRPDGTTEGNLLLAAGDVVSQVNQNRGRGRRGWRGAGRGGGRGGKQTISEPAVEPVHALEGN